MEGISVVDDLSLIYSSPDKQIERFKVLIKTFEKSYKTKPNFISRSPGRVNLIGEHIDYMGYGVLPMAIDLVRLETSKLIINKDTLIAANYIKDGESQIILKNIENDEFETKIIKFQSNGKIEINKDEHHWTNYALSGIKGALEEYKIYDIKGTIQLLVDGKVPRGSGLSSSSALVCSSMIMTTFMFNIKLSKYEIANLAAKSERFAGVEGGGMDQAISIMGEKGVAKYVKFDPLEAFSVEIPKNVSFVISNSLVVSNKKDSAEKNYNMRVIECRLGSAIIGYKLKCKGWERPKTLFKLQQNLNKSLSEMIEICNKILSKETYNIEQISKELNLKKEDLLENYFKSTSGNLIKIDLNEFKLLDRCVHIFSESKRVNEFIKYSKENDVKKLGDLMNQSHFSLKDKYEASCDGLEKLTEICRKSNALGSRLTGAGWGGCVFLGTSGK
eukprot:gene12611-6516_t